METIKFALPEVDTLKVYDNQAKEVVRITKEGRIFWRQREVETDDEFRSSMIEIRQALIKGKV